MIPHYWLQRLQDWTHLPTLTFRRGVLTMRKESSCSSDNGASNCTHSTAVKARSKPQTGGCSQAPPSVQQILEGLSAQDECKKIGGHSLAGRFFHTCQVRVVRFYVSCPAAFLLLLLLLLLRRTSTASPRSHWSPPDLHCKLRIKVFPAGPQPRSPDQSVPRRTSTTKNLRRYTS